MDINEAFPSKYFKAADVKDNPLQANIVAVVIEDVVGQGKQVDHKPVLRLQGQDKGIVLNKTNATILTDEFGTSETKDWVKQRVEVRAEKTQFQGKVVDGIRLSVPKQLELPLD